MAERYATIAQIIVKLPEINDIAAWLASSNAKIIDQENFAAAEVDASLRSVYSIPFSSSISATPLLIQELTAMLTALRICEIEFRQNTANRSEWVEEMKKNIYGDGTPGNPGMINKLLSGKLSLVSAAGVAVSRTMDVSSNTDGQEPVFGMGKNGEFEADRDSWET